MYGLVTTFILVTATLATATLATATLAAATLATATLARFFLTPTRRGFQKLFKGFHPRHLY